MTSTPTTTRIFRLWQARLDAPVWKHSIIRQWCKAVHNLAYNGTAAGFRTNLTLDEASDLYDQFQTRYPGPYDGPRVTEQQTELGRHWLATTGRRYGLDLADHPAAEITHFTFVGGETIDYATNYRPAYVTPVYVAFWPDGTTLRYWATPLVSCVIVIR